MFTCYEREVKRVCFQIFLKSIKVLNATVKISIVHAFYLGINLLATDL